MMYKSLFRPLVGFTAGLFLMASQMLVCPALAQAPAAKPKILFIIDWFETLRAFPPMRTPESHNLTQVLDMIKAGAGQPSD
jgi:hypothetical protein